MCLVVHVFFIGKISAINEGYVITMLWYIPALSSDRQVETYVLIHVFFIEKISAINKGYEITMLWHATALSSDDQFCYNMQFIINEHLLNDSF